jgi:hypothetical protein
VIIEALEAVFLFATVLMMAYLIRHYIFTLTVLKRNKKDRSPVVADVKYEPPGMKKK